MLSVCRYQLLDYNTVSHHFHLSTVTGSGKSDWLTKKQYVAVSLRTHSGRDLDGLCAFVCRSNKNKNCTAAHSNQFHSMPLFINIWMARISLSLSLSCGRFYWRLNRCDYFGLLQYLCFRAIRSNPFTLLNRFHPTELMFGRAFNFEANAGC